MTSSEFHALLKSQFPFDVTMQQDIVLLQLSNFIIDSDSNALYLLKGYAGTGKTTIIGTIVSQLWKIKKSAVLMAPTGRAAKVISKLFKKRGLYNS